MKGPYGRWYSETEIVGLPMIMNTQQSINSGSIKPPEIVVESFKFVMGYGYANE